MDALLVTGYPMPPTSNNSYYNVPGVGRVASKELKQYRKLCSDFEVKNKGVFNEIRKLLAKDGALHNHLKVDYFFTFKHERLYTKAGQPKKLDVANRVKHCQDCLFNSIGIDDKHIFCSIIEKVSGENESVTIVISSHTPITSIELIGMFQEVQESKALPS